jgi:hypothetical protein
MSRTARFAGLACVLIVSAVGVSTAAAASVSLLLPQAAAFSVLGASCGGIQEKAYATGFDPSSGYPTGAVYLSTSCGGSGRGGGYHTTTYSAWVGVIWDFTAAVISDQRLSAAPAVNRPRARTRTQARMPRSRRFGQSSGVSTRSWPSTWETATSDSSPTTSASIVT